MARNFNDQIKWEWDYQGIQVSPFASMGKPPLMAIFTHAAKDGEGNIIPGLQCQYPNMRGYTHAEIEKVIADPVGIYKHALKGHDLPAIARILGAASTFHDATEEELAAKMPKPQPVEVAIDVARAAATPALKIA